jgi:hypothetical protein
MSEQYEIRTKGQLDPRWAEWFDGFEIVHVAGDTLFSGVVVDQSALLGILLKLHDLGLRILAVNIVET